MRTTLQGRDQTIGYTCAESQEICFSAYFSVHATYGIAEEGGSDVLD